MGGAGRTHRKWQLSSAHGWQVWRGTTTPLNRCVLYVRRTRREREGGKSLHAQGCCEEGKGITLCAYSL